MDRYREHPSFAVVWNGYQLVPAPEATEAESVVWFGVPPDPDVPRNDAFWEALNATHVDDDIYRICASPALFAGVAFADQVQAVKSREGALVVTSIAGRGGYASARLWFEHAGDAWRLPVETLARAGCVIDVFSERLVRFPGRSPSRESLTPLSGSNQKGNWLSPRRESCDIPAREWSRYRS